jgi:colanic acid/amylovoran biosynthesis glycosyltransferase
VAEPLSQVVRVAYLTGRYPDISHTFILREVRALRECGVAVDTYSIWRTDRDRLLSAADLEEDANTYTALPLPLGALLLAHVHALVRAPRAYLALLATALRVATPGFRGRSLGLTWFAETILFWQRMRRRGTTHVHAHLQGTAPMVAMLIARFAGAAGGPRTWSLTVHGPTDFYNVDRERLPQKVRDATFVVAISDFARSQLMGQVESEHHDKIHVVHCGVDPDHFVPSPPNASAGPLRLLIVARLAPVKAHAVLLQAMHKLVAEGIDLQLTVIGDGPSRDDITRRIDEFGLTGRVRLLGSVGQDDILGHFQESDVFCLPSFAEGVPVVLMEAMALGKPVVASQVMGVGELVEDEVSGLLVRPGRADLVAAALRRLHEDPQLRRRLGEAGREKVKAEFTSDLAARQLAGYFRRYAAS